MKKPLLFLTTCALAMSLQAQTLIEKYPLDFGFVKGVNGTTGNSSTPTKDRANADNGAIIFSGSNYLDLGNPQINPANGFTLMFWVKPEAGAGNRSWIGNRKTCTTGSFFDVRGNGTNKAFSMELYQTNGTTAHVSNMTYTEGVWQHVALVVDPTQKKSYGYLNGVLMSTTPWTGSQILTGFTDIVNLYWSKSPCIGSNDGTKGFIGSVDDIQIYNGVQTPNFIATAAQASATTPSKNFTFADTKIYSNDMNSNCINNSATYKIGVSGSKDRANVDFSATKFDSASAALELKNSTIDPLAYSALNGGASAVSTWIKLSGNEPNGFIVANYADTQCGVSSGGRYIFRIIDNKLSCFLVFQSNNAVFTLVSGNTVLTPNTWYHVVMNLKQPFFNKDDVEFYVNGVKETTTALPNSTSTSYPTGAVIPAGTTASVSSIGGSIKGPTNSICYNGYSFNGHIDDINIYAHTLEASEVTSLYNAAAMSNTSNGSLTQKLSFVEKFDYADSAALATKYNAKLSGVSLTADRKGNPKKALLANGFNSYISTGINMDSVFADQDAFSYSIWIRPDQDMTNHLIIGHAGDGACENKRQQYFRINNKKVNFTAVYANNNGSNFRTWDGSTVLIPGTWYHVVVNVKQPLLGLESVEIFVNGVKENSTTTTGGTITTGYLPINGSILGIGNYLRTSDQTPCNTGSDPSFKGALDDIRIYDRLLCLSEIDQLFKEDPTITSTEINENTFESTAFMVPNPSNDGVFNLTQDGKVLSVTRVDGRAINFSQEDRTLKIEATSGLYIAIIKTGESVRAQRIQILN